MSGPRTLRILFGTISPGMPGGIYVTERPFEEACAASGEVEVRPLAFGRRRPEESMLERTVMRVADWLGYAWRVMRERPDVVHLNTAFDRRALVRDVGYAFLSSRLGQPLFLKFHGSDPAVLESDSGFVRWMTRATIGRTDAIGVLSSEEKENFVQAGYPADRFVVVKNVVDWRRLERGAWPRTDPGRLLFIARMVPTKGLVDVISPTSSSTSRRGSSTRPGSSILASRLKPLSVRMVRAESVERSEVASSATSAGATRGAASAATWNAEAR
jgi:glycosyltransferase involved in cell wall biosynthesis